jgi:hypothetical protein
MKNRNAQNTMKSFGNTGGLRRRKAPGNTPTEIQNAKNPGTGQSRFFRV